MGCINSKFNSDELVSRCKKRKNFMKQAVMYRNAFAAAHGAYLLALRNTGAALRQFADGEGGAPATGQGQFATMPEPPPPPPLPTPSPSLQENRALISSQKKDEEQPAMGDSSPTSPTIPAWDFFDPFRPSDPPLHLQEQRKKRQGQEKDWEDSKAELNPANTGEVSQPVDDGEQTSEATMETPTNEETAIVKWQSKSEDVLEGDVGMMMRLSVRKDLVEIVRELDEEFLKASAAGTEVSWALETRKARFHTNFPTSKDRKYHSARVFSALSWNWSRSPLSAKDEVENNAEENNKNGSHALTLERLLAWEKKLYEEVKLMEKLRCERQKKCSLLRRQEMRADDANAIDKTRAHIKKLHSLLLVSYQGVDSTIEAIEDLRDDDLQPQLVAMIEGLMNMWGTMHLCHAKQTQIVVHIKTLDALMTQDATTDVHHQATIQLERELTHWYETFCKLVASQRGYMGALYGWLRLNLMEIPTGKERIKEEEEEGAAKRGGAEVYRVCEEWQRALGCLPDKVASEAIKSLGEVVKAMVGKQEEELKQKRKVGKLEKQWERKANVLEGEEEGGEDEKRAAAEALKKKVQGEVVKHSRAVQDTRVLTMNNLQTGLPGVFEAMTGFSAVCAQAFQHLHSLTRLPGMPSLSS